MGKERLGSSTGPTLCPGFSRFPVSPPGQSQEQTAKVSLLLPEVWPLLRLGGPHTDVCCRLAEGLQCSSDLG